MATVDQIVITAETMLSTIQGIATALQAQASNAVSSAQTASYQSISTPTTPFDYIPDVVEPNVYIPQIAPNASVETILNEGDTLIESLKDNFTTFFGTYFPDECDYLAKAQSWICSVIDNDGLALDATTEALIHGRDTDRIEGEYAKALDEANNMWAGRGFALPTGAQVAAQLMARTNADKALGESSRALAIRQMELRIDTVKFAVGQAIDLRAKAIGAAADYLRVLMGGYDAAFKVVQQQNDAQAKLISAASEYYRSRLGVAELEFKASAMTAELKDKAAERFVQANVPLMTKRVDAAVDNARILGQQASAALSALHTGASVSASGQVL